MAFIQQIAVLQTQWPYTYIDAVKLIRTGPNCFVLNTGPTFFLYFWLFAVSSSFCRENELNIKKVALRTGSMMLRNMLGPVLNTTLDKF